MRQNWNVRETKCTVGIESLVSKVRGASAKAKRRKGSARELKENDRGGLIDDHSGTMERVHFLRPSPVNQPREPISEKEDRKVL